jgi:hypothetical protein
VQHFVGAGAWDDEAVMAELRHHVAEELGDPLLSGSFQVVTYCHDRR